MGFLSKTKDLDSKLNDFKEKFNITISLDELQKLMLRFGDEDLFFKYVEGILFNNRISLNELIKISSCIRNDEDFLATIKAVASYPQILSTSIVTNIIYSFSDKKLVSEVLTFIINLYKNNETGEIELENINNLEIAVNYLVEARRYYVDDRSLFASFISLVRALDINTLKYGSIEEMNKVINARLAEDKRSNGDYDISHEELEYFRQVCEELGIKSEQLKTLLSLSDKNISDTRDAYTALKQDATEYVKRELGKLARQSTAALNEFNQKYQELVNAEKNGILDDKEMLLSSLESTIGEKRAELISFVNKTKLALESDIASLRKEQRGILTDIDSYIENSQALKNVIMTAESDKEFMNKLDIVQKLAEDFESRPTVVKETVTEANPSLVVPVTSKVIMAPVDLGLDDPIDYTVLYYFDNATEFKKRFNKLMEKKKELTDSGEIFHEAFDDILKIIMHKDVPYLYGPSGTGKTYMIENQVGRLLGINIITSGYIQHEQDVLGYRNVGNGDYVPSNFYRAFTRGEGYFLDEIDNSNAKAATVLNPFFTGKKRDTYTFPDGRPTKKHPNFCIITAGNTKGEGRTVEYSSRQKLDESVLQRIWAIEIDYNNEIEKKILRDKKAWLEFAVSFRDAIEDIQLSGEDTINSSGTFTTRDASDVIEYLDDHTFTYRELIKYKFIQTKDPDYLRQIYSRMENTDYKEADSKKLLKEFKNQMDERAKKSR